MAPKKHYEAPTTTRVTRSSTRRASETELKSPNPKKQKKEEEIKPKEKAPSKPKKVVKFESSNGAKAEEGTEQAVDGSRKTIVIEHCKQCNSFKTRAALVKVGLEKDVETVNVVINPEKPRRGCFEVREEKGEVFVSLLDMKRPFKPMKDLDMDKVVSDIVDKIKC